MFLSSRVQPNSHLVDLGCGVSRVGCPRKTKLYIPKHFLGQTEISAFLLPLSNNCNLSTSLGLNLVVNRVLPLGFEYEQSLPWILVKTISFICVVETSECLRNQIMF